MIPWTGNPLKVTRHLDGIRPPGSFWISRSFWMQRPHSDELQCKDFTIGRPSLDETGQSRAGTVLFGMVVFRRFGAQLPNFVGAWGLSSFNRWAPPHNYKQIDTGMPTTAGWDITFSRTRPVNSRSTALHHLACSGKLCRRPRVAPLGSCCLSKRLSTAICGHDISHLKTEVLTTGQEV